MMVIIIAQPELMMTTFDIYVTFHYSPDMACSLLSQSVSLYLDLWQIDN